MSGTGKRKPGTLDGDDDGLLDALFGDGPARRPDPVAVLLEDPIDADPFDALTYGDDDDPETTEETPPTTLQVMQRRVPSLDLLKNDAAPMPPSDPGDPASVIPRPVAPVAATRPGSLPALRTSGLVPPSPFDDDEPIPVSSIEGRGFSAPQPASGRPKVPGVAPAAGRQQPLASARPNVGGQDWQPAPPEARGGRAPQPAAEGLWPDDSARLGYPAVAGPRSPPPGRPAAGAASRPPEPERLSQPTWPSDRPQVRAVASPSAGPEVRAATARATASSSLGSVPIIVEAPRSGRSQRAAAPIDDFDDAPVPRAHLVPEARASSSAAPAPARQPTAPGGTPLWWWVVGGVLVLLVGYWVYGLAQADLARVSP